MKHTQKPLISIGMIFRDDIRCIERCLKALQPLRDAIPCELIMADTGSEDGSREIADKYADLVIDFPWINDFSAARNSVVERCSGRWYLVIDTDEYLREDSDIEEFRKGLNIIDAQGFNMGAVSIRNHTTYDFTGPYGEFLGVRLIRLSLGARYEGVIHEHWNLPSGKQTTGILGGLVFDHDGYVEFSSKTEAGRKKLERNIKLLREELEENPNNLVTRLQMIESGGEESDFLDQIRCAVNMVREKADGWKTVGPTTMRHAVEVAYKRKMPELEEWAEMAWEMFPESMYIRLDAEHSLFSRSWENKEYEDCTERGERFLLAMKDFRAGKDSTARLYGVLRTASLFYEQLTAIIMSNAYVYIGKPERALELLSGLDYAAMVGQQVVNLLKSAQELQYRSELDTKPLIRAIWEGINEPKPSQKQADDRLKIFNFVSAQAFMERNQKLEREKEDFKRPGYTLYLPLKGKSEVGNAAEIMRLEDTAELEAVLRGVEKWSEFPIEAMAHALEFEVQFPLPDKVLPIEEMEGLTTRLAKQQNKENMNFCSMVVRRSRIVPSDWQALTWQRGLVMSAVRAFDWEKEFKEEEKEKKERHKELGRSIVRAFAETERVFIPRYYAPETWAEENIYVLPPMHRFGWHCAQAFDCLDRGDFSGCLQSLRNGMAVYEDIAKLVEFMINQVEDMERASRIATAPPELIELAKQVKLMLSRFAPDDPAVVELKKSAAYQQVAWLIEEPASMVETILQ